MSNDTDVARREPQLLGNFLRAPIVEERSPDHVSCPFGEPVQATRELAPIDECVATHDPRSRCGQALAEPAPDASLTREDTQARMARAARS